jgi:hypothetical protein
MIPLKSLVLDIDCMIRRAQDVKEAIGSGDVDKARVAAERCLTKMASLYRDLASATVDPGVKSPPHEY